MEKSPKTKNMSKKNIMIKNSYRYQTLIFYNPYR